MANIGPVHKAQIVGLIVVLEIFEIFLKLKRKYNDVGDYCFTPIIQYGRKTLFRQMLFLT